MLKIVNEAPPADLLAAIVKAIPAVAECRRPIFTYGDRIFNPSGSGIDPELYAHESVHSERQGRHPNPWWERYLSDPAFRLEEEMLGHVAEYLTYCTTHLDRNKRTMALHRIALRLAGPLYGGLITYPDAKAEILHRQ
jgi:hypothetical protein